jgi:hypothetical protein
VTVYALGVVTAATIEQLDDRDIGSSSGILSLVVVITMLLVDMVLCRLVDHRLRRGAAGPRTLHASYVPVLRRGIHVVVTVCAWSRRLWGSTSSR